MEFVQYLAAQWLELALIVGGSAVATLVVLWMAHPDNE